MNKSFLRLYFINILNLLLICFLIQSILTLFFNYPNENADFSGINIWLLFVVFLIYKLGKILKTDSGKFLIGFFLCFILLFIVSRYFTIFDFIEPNYYGYKTKLFNFMPLDYDVKKFMFWQTGIASGYNYEQYKSNYIITFFTIPPIALFECLIKAIFPNLYILILIQLPIILLKRKVLNWKSE
jgi:hypothetical protein